MFILKLNGRTSTELQNTYRSFDEQLRYSLDQLDGNDNFSLVLFHVPDDAGWPDGPDFHAADYEAEYIQGVGRADALVVEIRRREGDGRYRQFALSRPAIQDRPLVTVRWQESSTTVPRNEIFVAEEAATIFDFYRQHRSVPDGYSLRELGLS